MKIFIRIITGIALALALLAARALLPTKGNAEGFWTKWFGEAHAVAKPRILFLGDSHSCFKKLVPKRFSSTIYEGLKQDGAAVALYAACGASAQSWVKGGTTDCGYRALTTGGYSVNKPVSEYPRLASLVREQKPQPDLVIPKPDHIIIELGDNLFGWETIAGIRHSRCNRREVKRQVNQLLDAISTANPNLLKTDPRGRPYCLWIGPTKGGEGPIYEKSPEALRAMTDALRDSLAGKCLFIDSTNMIGFYAGPDGLHLNDQRSAQWGTAALNEIRKNLK